MTSRRTAASPSPALGGTPLATLVQLVPAAMLAGLTLYFWRSPHFTYQEPAWWYVALSFTALLLTWRAVPTAAWLYALLGLATVFWSLAPGHTLVSGLWEIGFLAALAVGRWRPGFVVLALMLLYLGLEQGLLLHFFGFLTADNLLLYAAGEAALAALGVGLSLMVVRRPAVRSLGFLASAAALYLVLLSGARAAYLPLALLAPLAVVALLRAGVKPRSVFLGAAGLVLLVAAADVAIPGRPAIAAVARNLPLPAADTEATGAPDQPGNVVWRLRMADQTLRMALQNPLGTGAGSFPAVVHAYQRYPLLWASNPHNLYLETAATGGWLRLALLLWLLLGGLWRGWTRGDRLLTLGVAALWIALAFDLGSSNPGFMLVAFWALGAVWGPAAAGERKGYRASGRAAMTAGIVTLTAFGVLVAWWYLPCRGAECAIDRYLGFTPRVLPVLDAASPAERAVLLDPLTHRYPASLWTYQLRANYAADDASRLAAAREIAQRFPYHHPEDYLTWAEAAAEAGQIEEAVHALELGLEHFPASPLPSLGRRLDAESYRQLVAKMERARDELLAGAD